MKSWRGTLKRRKQKVVVLHWECYEEANTKFLFERRNHIHRKYKHSQVINFVCLLRTNRGKFKKFAICFFAKRPQLTSLQEISTNYKKIQIFFEVPQAQVFIKNVLHTMYNSLKLDLHINFPLRFCAKGKGSSECFDTHLNIEHTVQDNM